MDWFFGVVIASLLAAVPIVFVAILYHRKRERERTEAMRATCELMQFSFTPKVAEEETRQWGNFALFALGHSRKAKNVMRGQVDGQAVVLFDYQYTESAGQHSQTFRYTVAVLKDGARGVPDFRLTLENVLHKIGQWFGYQDIDFPDDPEFSRKYLLRGPDEEAVRDTFTPELRHFLMSALAWHVEVKGGHLLAHQGSRCPPERCPEFLADVFRLQGYLRSAAEPLAS